uniref:CSD domain-containing protein n=2 Tax=Meloidogyne TaxID=189290 RepID=A0A915LLU8_MELJA
MTVETDLAKRVGELNLEKRVDEVTEKMEKKLSSDSMNGESFDKRVRQLRGPIVIGRAQHGIVKWFSVAKGYGFIRVDGSEKDCFVHASAILRTVNVPLALIENQQVEFDIIEGLKGPEAVCVSGPGGVRVGKTIGYMYKGTFYHTYPRFRQPPMLPVRYPAGQRHNNTVEHKQNSNMGKKVDAGGEKNGNRQKAIEGVEGEGKAIVHDEKTTEGKTRSNKKRFHRRYYRHPVADKSKSATNTTTKGEDEKKEVVGDETKKDGGGQGTKEEPSTVNTTSTATSPHK